jgi:HlyD family secretion protein
MPQEAVMSTNRPLSRFFAIALLALLLGAGAFGYWRSTQDRLPEGLSMGNGRLESTEVQIAAKIPGRLAEVRVDEGDKVLKGQLLARMDTRTLEAQRAQAEAEVLRAKENLAAAEATVQLRQSEQLLANQELKRTQELYKRGFASGQLIDQQQSRQSTGNAAVVAAQAQVNSVRAAIGAAQAQVAQLTSEIDDSSLRAPIDGIIQLRLAEPGEVLGAGGRVLLLIDPEDQYMNLYLPASVTGALTVGSDARILLDALPGQSLPAKISFVAAKSQFTPKEVETRDERQKLVFRVKLRLTQPSAVPQAKPGMPGAGYVRTADIDWPANLQ